MSGLDHPNSASSHKYISKQLKSKANDFLNSRKNANNLIYIINYLEDCVEREQPLHSCILTLEVIFTELLKRREFFIDIKPLKPKDESPETKYKEWLHERYEETFRLLLNVLSSNKNADSIQALVTCMKLLSWEGKYPINNNDATPCNEFPLNRYRDILLHILNNNEQSNNYLIGRFKEYTDFIDIVYYGWKLIINLIPKGQLLPLNDIFKENYLNLINALPVTKDLMNTQQLFCYLLKNGDNENNTVKQFDYMVIRRYINKVWNCVMQWDMKELIHKQILIILLERILPHLEKPVLLTDFLMDSLDFGGPIGLLALQGVFTLIQKHNITYPNIYEKLYSMFEPEIFHTKFKARLFYLADIFLSSTYLPENLVAAFIKRLARLTLIAPPQDIVIILYFIGNLILRHPGLKRLICHPNGGEVSKDPYIMDEREPTKSNALESSLWEIVALQNHAIPSISNAAKFIAQPLPSKEWDLSSVLEFKEDDIFDQEIAKKWQQCSLSFERPQSMFLPKSDKIIHYWKFF